MIPPSKARGWWGRDLGIALYAAASLTAGIAETRNTYGADDDDGHVADTDRGSQ